MAVVSAECECLGLSTERSLSMIEQSKGKVPPVYESADIIMRRIGEGQGYIWLFSRTIYCRCISNSYAGRPAWCHYFLLRPQLFDLQCGFGFASFACKSVSEPDLGVSCRRKYCHWEGQGWELVGSVPVSENWGCRCTILFMAGARASSISRATIHTIPQILTEGIYIPTLLGTCRCKVSRFCYIMCAAALGLEDGGGYRMAWW